MENSTDQTQLNNNPSEPSKHGKLSTKVSFDLGPASPTPPSTPNSAPPVGKDRSMYVYDSEFVMDTASKVKADLRAKHGSSTSSLNSIDSAMGALALMSSHTSLSSLSSLGDKRTGPLESKVLIIYVGGTIGMKIRHGVYVPEPNYIHGALKGMPMFHDAEAAKELGVPEDVFVLPCPPNPLEIGNEIRIDHPNQDNHQHHPIPENNHHHQLNHLPMIQENIKNLNGTVSTHISSSAHSMSRENRRVYYWLYEYEELKDSSNLTIDDWVQIVKDIYRFYRQYDGFVILHGTDTMAYSASALSFMMENLGKPVILTGAQVPLAELRSDGRDNMLGAIYIAGHYVIPEVTLYFDNKLFRGNRTSKCSSESFNAFASPNLPPLLKLHVNVEVDWGVIFRSRNTEAFSVSLNMNGNVGLLRIFPGITTATVKAFLNPPMQGVVLQTFGAGNGPDSREDLMTVIRAASERGVLIINCTQCSTGSVSPSYHTGKVLLDAGVIPGSDITPEAALTKLSYVLGKEGLTVVERRKLLSTNLRGEIKVAHMHEKSFTLLDNKFIRAVADTLRITSAQEVKAVGDALFPPMMCAAAANGDLAGLKHLTTCGADLSSGDYDGRTPLHLAACTGDVNMVKFLLESGCVVHERDRFGNTAFTESIRCKHLEVIKIIKRAGGHLVHQTEEEIGTMLCAAVYIEDRDGLEAFNVAGVDLSAKDYRGNTALHLAALDSRLECLSYLVQHVKDLDVVDFNGNTAMELAEKYGNDYAVRILNQALEMRERAEVDSDLSNDEHMP